MFGSPIVTQIVPAGPFYPAEDYHQQYFEKRGSPNSCHVGPATVHTHLAAQAARDRKAQAAPAATMSWGVPVAPSRHMTRRRLSDDHLTASKFEALPDSEKNRILQEIEAEDPAQRLARAKPLGPRERARWNKFKKRIGRPRVGKGSAVVSLSIEKELLKYADAYAKAHKMGRSELFTRGLKLLLGAA